MVCDNLVGVVPAQEVELTMKTYIKPSLRSLGFLRLVTRFSF